MITVTHSSTKDRVELVDFSRVAFVSERRTDDWTSTFSSPPLKQFIRQLAINHVSVTSTGTFFNDWVALQKLFIAFALLFVYNQVEVHEKEKLDLQSVYFFEGDARNLAVELVVEASVIDEFGGDHKACDDQTVDVIRVHYQIVCVDQAVDIDKGVDV